MIKSLIGQKFNYLEVIDGPIIKNKKTYWKCRCDCGKEKEIRSDGLKSGSTKSCGCYKNISFPQSIGLSLYPVIIFLSKIKDIFT